MKSHRRRAFTLTLCLWFVGLSLSSTIAQTTALDRRAIAIFQSDDVFRVAINQEASSSIEIYDGDGNRISILEPSFGASGVNAMNWNAEGNRLAIIYGGSERPNVAIWDVDTPSIVAEQQIDIARFVYWHPQNPNIIMIVLGQEIVIWDLLGSSDLVAYNPLWSDIQTAQWSSNGTYIGLIGGASHFQAISSSTLNVVFERRENVPLPERQNFYFSFGFSPSEDQVALYDLMNSEIEIWNILTNQVEIVFDSFEPSVEHYEILRWVDKGLIGIDLHLQQSVIYNPDDGAFVPIAQGQSYSRAYVSPSGNTILFLPPQIQTDSPFFVEVEIPDASISNCTDMIAQSDTPALISAIQAANGAGSPQTICLEEGTYTLTNHHNITTGRNGFPVISNRGRSLTIVGLGNGATISRWSSGNFRFFYVAPDGTLTLDNITLSNGYAPGNEIAGAGGAILNEGVLWIKNSILIGNRANTQAGAIYSPGVTQLEDTAILDSVANTDGGAIFTALTGRVEILRGEIRNNSANTGSGRGGAIYINGGYVRVVDALIQGNSAYTGGGIYITKSASAYSTLLQIAGGSRILENFAGAGSGGGLYSTSSGVTLISDALFSGNRTSGVGAGIWSAGVLTIRDSAFESNGDTNFGTAGAIYSFGTLSLSDARIGNNLVRSTVSGRGGGVYIAGGMASIHQTEFIGNRAGNGAGLYTINSDTTITNSTFQGNIASHNGGAINNNARITVRDSLFTQNDDAAGGEDVYSASATVHRLVATSCFVNTNPAESGVFSTTMNFDARNNWWGSSSGPFAGSPPGTGQVNGNIVYSPFVTEGCAPTTGAGVPESDRWLRLEHVCVQSDGSADVWRVTNLNSAPIVFWYRWTDSNDLGGTLEAPGNGSVEIEIERALPGSITGVGASVRIVVDDVVQAQAIVSNVPGWVQPPVCPE